MKTAYAINEMLTMMLLMSGIMFAYLALESFLKYNIRPRNWLLRGVISFFPLIGIILFLYTRG